MIVHIRLSAVILTILQIDRLWMNTGQGLNKEWVKIFVIIHNKSVNQGKNINSAKLVWKKLGPTRSNSVRVGPSWTELDRVEVGFVASRRLKIVEKVTDCHNFQKGETAYVACGGL